ncbi:hypothetical protein Lser_V15G26728 [Lactuca serriola]
MMNIDNENELHENLEDEIGEENDEEAPFDNNVEVPSTFTNMDGTNLNIDDNWIVSQSTKSYVALPKYLGALQKFNPGTIVERCVSRSTDVDEVEFRRVFWAFAPFIKGFHYCRPVISIDGTHLYGKYTGKMLIAMGVNGNNQILPLAFAIVENESYNTWNWFLSHVKNHVVKDREGICLISDRHGGILKAVNEHGSPWYCLRHFINNFYDKFHNSVLKALAYRVGSQNQIRKFNSIMEEIGKLNPHARHCLESHPLNRWTLAYDGGRRYGLVTTNLSEIFNSVLKGARFLPITACVQLTFYRMVHYFEVRRPLGSSSLANGDAHTPHVIAKQVALMAKASAHSLRSFNREKGIFELITQKGRNVQVVNLEQKTCTCGNRVIIENGVRLSQGKDLLSAQVQANCDVFLFC